jgi:hypothetical protein
MSMIPETDSFLRLPSDRYEDWYEYMWIGPSEKCFVFTSKVCIFTLLVGPVAVHFVEVGSDIVEVKLAGAESWMSHGVRREGKTLWWTIMGRDVPWVFVPADAVPSWAHNAFATGRLRLMKEKENGEPGLS